MPKGSQYKKEKNIPHSPNHPLDHPSFKSRIQLSRWNDSKAEAPNSLTMTRFDEQEQKVTITISMIMTFLFLIDFGYWHVKLFVCHLLVFVMYHQSPHRHHSGGCCLTRSNSSPHWCHWRAHLWELFTVGWEHRLKRMDGQLTRSPNW